MGTVIAAILGALGFAFAQEGARDIVNGVGMFASQKWRQFVKDLQKVISENSQMLQDFKTKSENEKAQIANSLIQSSGLGQRADTLRKEALRLKQNERELTDKVTQANIKASNDITDAERRIANAETGLVGAGEALLRDTADANQYKVNDPDQNVNGGLQKGNN